MGLEIVLDASDEPFLSGRGPSSRAVQNALVTSRRATAPHGWRRQCSLES